MILIQNTRSSFGFCFWCVYRVSVRTVHIWKVRFFISHQGNNNNNRNSNHKKLFENSAEKEYSGNSTQKKLKNLNAYTRADNKPKQIL